MIYFYKNYTEEAFKLIAAKGTVDDVKAAMDLENIERVMRMDKNISLFVHEGTKLDERLKREYPEIRKMCDIANSMLLGGTENEHPQYYTDTCNIRDILITDSYGILTSVLVKHNIVSSIKEFIQRVE